MKRNGSPEPIFKTDDDSTYFLITLMAHIEKEVHDKAPVKALDKALVKVYDQLNQTEITILNICSVQPKSVSEISNSIGHSKVSGNIKKGLANLLKSNYLAFTIPEKPNSRNQKYQITQEGINFLENI